MENENNNNEVRTNWVWVRVNDLEKTAMVKKAERAGISMSELLRDAALNVKIHSTADTESVEELVKINVDMRRLGNLFKLALNDKAANRMFKKEDLESLLKSIESHIQLMQGVMRKINAF